MVLVVKNLPAPAGDARNVGSITRWKRSPAGVRCHFLQQGIFLQHSGLENSKDRGVWQAIVHGIAESDMTEEQAHMGIK